MPKNQGRPARSDPVSVAHSSNDLSSVVGPCSTTNPCAARFTSRTFAPHIDLARPPHFIAARDHYRPHTTVRARTERTTTRTVSRHETLDCGSVLAPDTSLARASQAHQRTTSPLARATGRRAPPNAPQPRASSASPASAGPATSQQPCRTCRPPTPRRAQPAGAHPRATASPSRTRPFRRERLTPFPNACACPSPVRARPDFEGGDSGLPEDSGMFPEALCSEGKASSFGGWLVCGYGRWTRLRISRSLGTPRPCSFSMKRRRTSGLRLSLGRRVCPIRDSSYASSCLTLTSGSVGSRRRWRLISAATRRSLRPIAFLRTAPEAPFGSPPEVECSPSASERTDRWRWTFRRGRLPRSRPRA